MLPATLSGSICPQRNHRSTPSLQPVSTLQQLTQSLPLSVCWATALGWANTALMQWAHSCATHLHRQTGHSPSATSTTAGQSLHPLHLPMLSSVPRCKRARVGNTNLNSTQYPYSPFQGPTYSQGGYHNIDIYFAIEHLKKVCYVYIMIKFGHRKAAAACT